MKNFSLCVSLPDLTIVKHSFSSFNRALRKVRFYLSQHPGCVCFLSHFDLDNKKYVLHRYTVSSNDILQLAL